MAYHLTLNDLPSLPRSKMDEALPLFLKSLSSNPEGWQSSVTVSGYEWWMQDTFRFEAKAGAKYELAALSYNDPNMLAIYDNQGAPVAWDDYEPDDGPPLVVNGVSYQRDVIHDWVAPYTGTYYIRGLWYTDESHQFYSLSLSEDAHTTYPTTTAVPNATVVDEGMYVSYTVKSSTIEPGTVLNWILSGVNADDIGARTTSGTVKIDSYGKAYFGFYLALDLATEGPETVTLLVGDSSGKVLATAPAVRINDTSLTLKYLYGTVQDDVLVGTGGHDQIEGFDGADILQGGAGSDTLNGGVGVDVARYAGVRADFKVEKTDEGWKVTDKTGAEGTDTLHDIETLRFADVSLALDLSGTAGQAYRIYQAAFNRPADLAGLGFWINYLDKGGSVEGMAAGFADSNEFRSIYGATPTNSELVGRIYQNVLHRTPDQAGFDYWVGVLDKHAASVTQVLAGFSESPENQAALIGVVGTGITYIPYG
jgi:Ca2+-binding RTX toxin-like protein